MRGVAENITYTTNRLWRLPFDEIARRGPNGGNVLSKTVICCIRESEGGGGPEEQQKCLSVLHFLYSNQSIINAGGGTIGIRVQSKLAASSQNVHSLTTRGRREKSNE